jgi:WD40 repeat protein
VASAGEDRTVKLHDAATGRERATFTIGSEGGILSLAFSRDGRALAAGGTDGLEVWETATDRPLLALRPEKSADNHINVGALAFSPDGRMLAAAAQDSAVKLWEFPGGRELLTLGGRPQSAFALAFSPDGRTLASAGEDRTVKLWDPVTGEYRATLRGHPKGVAALTFADRGQVLISGSIDGTVKLWRAAPWQAPAKATQGP